ncbi:MAG: hypothetical protein ACREEE_09705 [Dongiaceae bacterium]
MELTEQPRRIRNTGRLYAPLVRRVDSMRIVLADDHDLVRDMIAEHLFRVDPSMEVVLASNLPEALELA